MSVIQSIGSEQASVVVKRTDAAPEPSSLRATVAPSGGAGNREYVVRVSSEAVEIAKLQETKNAFHDAAKSVRTEDRSMGMVIDYIDRMKEELKSIVKQYPPYPPGSEARVDFLKNFSAFRRQIERLTLPPPSQESAATGQETMENLPH